MKPSDFKTLTVRAPGKLILSGEHAVVYGQPALAMAVNRYTETSIRWQAGQKNILFDLLNFRYYQAHSLTTLRQFKLSIQEKYQKFLQGQYSIRDVLSKPFELLQYAVTHFIDKRRLQLPRGVEIHTDSTIPIGCGMGSSAAAIVSVMYAISRFFQLDIDAQSCYQLAWEAENMQHGHSSGVDVHLVLKGGCIRFQKEGQIEARVIPQRSLLLVNTGSPQATTGECVSVASTHLKGDAKMLADFAQVTEGVDRSLMQNDLSGLQNSVRENHRLLIKIGVVPSKIQRFIADIEKEGGVAKICGAGAVHGDNAGIVLVIAEQDLTNLIQSYGYTHFFIQGEPQGTRVI